MNKYISKSMIRTSKYLLLILLANMLIFCESLIAFDYPKSSLAEDKSELHIFATNEVNIIIEDDTGSLTGFDRVSNRIIEQIPYSTYFINGLEDNLTGIISEKRDIAIYIAYPSSDSYRISLTGLKLGIYNLELKCYLKNGDQNPKIVFNGTTNINCENIFYLKYDPEFGTKISAIRALTFDTILDDIQNCYELGLIKKNSLLLSLKYLIQIANKLYDMDKIIASKSILIAFSKLIQSQTSKNIDKKASDILLDDAYLLMDNLSKHISSTN